MLSALFHHRARTLISAVMEEWLLEIQRFSVDTQRHYRATINSFFLDLSKKYIKDVSSTDIKQYLTKFRWTHKETTCNTNLGAIKSFFRYASNVYGITNVASGIPEYKEKMPHRPFISKKDLDTILSNATQREKDIILMLAHTGMRCSELCSLRPENLSPNLSSITIQGKGGKVRTIPCNQTVREIISRRGINFPKNRKSIYNICNNTGKRIACRNPKGGAIHLAPHMLRRYFATQLLAKGVSLLIISRLLGHSSVQTTERYLCIDSSFLLGSTDVLD